MLITNDQNDLLNAAALVGSQIASSEKSAQAKQNASEDGDTVSISGEAMRLFAAMRSSAGRTNAVEPAGEDGGQNQGGAAGGGMGGASGGSSSEDIQSQISALQAQVASLTMRMQSGDEGLSGQIAALEAQIASLKAQLAA